MAIGAGRFQTGYRVIYAVAMTAVAVQMARKLSIFQINPDVTAFRKMLSADEEGDTTAGPRTGLPMADLEDEVLRLRAEVAELRHQQTPDHRDAEVDGVISVTVDEQPQEEEDDKKEAVV